MSISWHATNKALTHEYGPQKKGRSMSLSAKTIVAQDEECRIALLQRIYSAEVLSRCLNGKDLCGEDRYYMRGLLLSGYVEVSYIDRTPWYSVSDKGHALLARNGTI